MIYTRKILLALGLITLLNIITTGATSENQEIKVMSFNVRYGTADDGPDHWDKRKDLLFETIKQFSPDVLGLQEALRSQIDQIKQAMPGYTEIGEGRDGGTKGEYSVILYTKNRFRVEDSGTFWLSDTPEVVSKHWGNAFIRICTWGRFIETESQQAFYVFNTHLDNESQPSREKSVRLIARRIHTRAHPDPVILTGDFNAAEDNPAIRYLKGTETDGDTVPVSLRDTFRVLHPDEEQVGTFNGFKGTATGGKIDYIFVTPQLRVLTAAIVRRNRDGHYPSDHFPVTARLRFEDTLK